MHDPEGVRRNIGFMSCNTGIYDRMTAREMVEYFGRLYGIPEDKLQARIQEIFDVLQMHEIRDRLGSKMSTGMKQKVSIARTIVHDPPVIIFDEPTSGLDVLVARNVLQTVAALKEQGKCIIFSTHIMREVEKLCDRIAVIHKGRIVDEGTLPELADRHDQPDVEELFFDLIREDEKTSWRRRREEVFCRAGSQRLNRLEETTTSTRKPVEAGTTTIDELEKRQTDLSPRGPRPAAGPSYAVHDYHSSRAAVPDAGTGHGRDDADVQ